VADRGRDDQRALDALDRALVAAEPEDIRRPFHAPGRTRLAALLQHRQQLADDDAYAATILAGFGADSAVSAPEVLNEPLTDRERLVLRHIAKLQTNEEIAAELFLSVNTIKTHIRTLYRKLDVSSRRQAVNRGRELGLL
ncbi:MAG TPA: LuxR C-terminal-related transcriptional regulator, partial [Microlunatus sp.]|nr:LuxR C-terminal-related transcriptional regulator [Microlunatus sp.]